LAVSCDALALTSAVGAAPAPGGVDLRKDRMMNTHDDPDKHPAVQAAYEQYAAAAEAHNRFLFASGQALHPWKRAEALAAGETFETDPTHATERRLYQADKAHYAAWHAVNKEAHPELYCNGAGPGFRHPDQWQEMYPHVACEPTPREFGLTDDPRANWGDFYIAPDGTVTRFVVAEAEAELEAGS
jgi:hypothetical protein